MNRSHFVAHLALESDVGAELTRTRIRLLEAVDGTGSISQAAKRVPLSYKAAWDAIDQINNLSAQAVVERSAGGSGGGGTRLTDYGRRVVAFYRALERHYQSALDQVAVRLDEPATEAADFGQLLRNLNWRSSARNQFAGQVVALQTDELECAVRIRLDETTELIALVTRESAEALALPERHAVVALVKASSVMITTDPQLRLSAQNQLWGEVERLHNGPVNHEVVLALPAGRRVTAVLTAQSSRQLGLALGVRACACFNASSVLLLSSS